MKYLVTVAGETLEIDVERRPDGSYCVRDGASWEANVCRCSAAEQAGIVCLAVDGQMLEVQPADGEVHFRQERYAARAESFRDRAAARASANDATQGSKLVASMPGRIVRILCQPGATVAQGAALIVIEAMKMQNELCAKADAIVRAVHVSEGQTVERGAVLLELEMSPAHSGLT
jgi:biotin carboxyl carrier protein